MECNYSQIESVFADYIIKLIGPSFEQDQFRQSRFNLVKSVLEKALKDQGITPHIFSFGSFPIRTYLPESDMDVTIILEDTVSGQVMNSFSIDYQNKILNLIQYSLEMYNQEVGYAQVTEINMIPAEVKLIKCKIDNLSFDISINNFVGLFKLNLMNYLETKCFDKTIFKRTLFLVKCWSYYEGNILGSNVGLMASYALEVLIIYMFNNFSHKFTNEIEAVFYFFSMINDIDCSKKIITIFGLIPADTYYEDLKNNNFSLNPILKKIVNENKFSKIDLDDLISFTNNFDRININDKLQNLGKKSIDIRLLNLVDPIFHTNNLGKSLNFHNFSKIKKVFEFAKEDAEILSERKKNGSISPFEYLNSLTKMFSKIIVNNNPDLFYFNLPQPKIIIFPSYNNLENENEDEDTPDNKLNNISNSHSEDILQDLSKLKIEKTSEFQNQIVITMPNKLNEELIKKFNEKFLDSKRKLSECLKENKTVVVKKEYPYTKFLWPTNQEIKDESEIHKLINDYFNENEIYITKEMVEFFLSNEDNSSLSYKLVTFGEISQVEEYIKNCKINIDS